MTDLSIPAVRGFLTRLDADNTRDFFQRHKAEYDTVLKAPAQTLVADLAPEIADLTGHDVTTRLFRPHRDVRFAKDKTPYTTHLHMLWSLAAGGRQDPAMFFGIGLDYATIGLGVMGFDRPVLEDWRKLCDLDAERIAAERARAEAAGFAFREPELKRVPAPHDADHPLADFLRSKSLIAWKPLPDGPDLARTLMTEFAAGLPVLRILDPVL